MYPNNVKYLTLKSTILIWVQFNKFPLAKSLKITWHCNDLIRECLVYNSLAIVHFMTDYV